MSSARKLRRSKGVPVKTLQGALKGLQDSGLSELPLMLKALQQECEGLRGDLEVRLDAAFKRIEQLEKAVSDGKDSISEKA